MVEVVVVQQPTASPNKSCSRDGTPCSSPINKTNTNNQSSPGPAIQSLSNTGICQAKIQIRFKATQAPTSLLVVLGVLCLVCFVRLMQINEAVFEQNVRKKVISSSELQLATSTSTSFLKKSTKSQDIYLEKVIRLLEEEQKRLRNQGQQQQRTNVSNNDDAALIDNPQHIVVQQKQPLDDTRTVHNHDNDNNSILSRANNVTMES